MLQDKQVVCLLNYGDEWKDFKLLLSCAGCQTGRDGWLA